MTEFLFVACLFVLVMDGISLWRILRGPGDAERMMAAQLVSTGGIAALLLLGVATGQDAIVDIALTVALLAAFVAMAFVNSAPADGERER